MAVQTVSKINSKEYIKATKNLKKSSIVMLRIFNAIQSTPSQNHKNILMAINKLKEKAYVEQKEMAEGFMKLSGITKKLSNEEFQEFLNRVYIDRPHAKPKLSDFGRV